MRKSVFIALAPMLATPLAISALVAPAAAHADPSTDAFLAALANTGVGVSDPAGAIALGQSVCPMLSQPGQTTADVAAAVANAGGMSLGPATMFTGAAISIFCPLVLSSIGNGQSPIPLSLPGF